MTREKLRRLSATCALHSLPKPNALARVVCGTSHVMQPNLVSFGFEFSAELHEYAELRASTERSHDCTLFVVIHDGHQDCDARERSLREFLFQIALRTMAGGGVRHFVAEHRREPSLAFGDGKNTG